MSNNRIRAKLGSQFTNLISHAIGFGIEAVTELAIVGGGRNLLTVAENRHFITQGTIPVNIDHGAATTGLEGAADIGRDAVGKYLHFHADTVAELGGIGRCQGHCVGTGLSIHMLRVCLAGDRAVTEIPVVAGDIIIDIRAAIAETDAQTFGLIVKAGIR